MEDEIAFSVTAIITQAQYVDFFIDRLPHVVIIEYYPSLKRTVLSTVLICKRLLRAGGAQNSKACAETGHSQLLETVSDHLLPS
jgi:hypothetical protein